MTGRFPPKSPIRFTEMRKWHKIIGDPTLGDAILDRLVHNAHKLTLKGDSLRKKGKKMQS